MTSNLWGLWKRADLQPPVIPAKPAQIEGSSKIPREEEKEFGGQWLLKLAPFMAECSNGIQIVDNAQDLSH